MRKLFFIAGYVFVTLVSDAQPKLTFPYYLLWSNDGNGCGAQSLCSFGPNSIPFKEVVLLDHTGISKSIMRPKEKLDQLQLNVSKYRPGIYFLIVTYGKEREKHQIIINR